MPSIATQSGMCYDVHVPLVFQFKAVSGALQRQLTQHDPYTCPKSLTRKEWAQAIEAYSILAFQPQ
eukprot:468730-Alexandrium_andersonii.AAC.1